MRARSCLLACLLLAGCATGDPRESRATAAVDQWFANDPTYAEYAVRIAGEGASDATAAIITRGLERNEVKLWMAAARAAADRGLESARPLLTDKLQNGRGLVQLEAACALNAMGDPAAAEWLAGQMTDTGFPNLRLVVCLARAEGNDDVLRAALERGLASDEQEFRDETYAAIGEVDRPWVAEVVGDGLSDEFGEGRRSAILALGHVGGPDDAGAITRFSNTRGLIFATAEALGRMGGEQAVKTLSRMADSDQVLVRAHAAVGLLRAGETQQGLELANACATAEDPTVRHSLAEQLLGVEGSETVLAGLVADDDADVRIAALRSLASIGARVDEAALLEAAADPNYQVAAAAMDLLAAQGSEAAVEALEGRLEDSNGYRALSAAVAVLEILGRQGAAQAG